MKHYLTIILLILTCTAYSLHPKLVLLAKVEKEIYKKVKEVQKKLVNGTLKPCKIHNRTKIFQCPVCPKQYDKWYLPQHMNLHTGAKPFECDNCNQKFALQYQHIRHKKKCE